MKSYILIPDDVPVGFAIVAAAHASLAMYLRFQSDADVAEWVTGPFRKVVCRVSRASFDRAKEIPDHVVLTESALQGREVALAYKPRREWPKSFQFFQLYK